MIAVLMATFNGEKYIASAIESILNQSYSDFILYIHDDGSDDNTCKIVDKYVKLFPTKIKVFFHEAMHSTKKNFLYLLNEVNADWYMFADQDDVWHTRKMEYLMQTARKCSSDNNRSVLVFSDMEVVDSDLRLISNSFVRYNRIDTSRNKLNQVISQNIVPGCSCLFNKTLRQEALKYSDIEKLRVHDWWIACVAAATGKIIFDNRKLVKYRQHGNNAIGAKKDNFFRDLNYVSKIFTSNQIQESHSRTEMFVKQACELKNVSFVKEKDKKMIEDLVQFKTVSKIRRIALFSRYEITRSKRNLWMYFSL